MVSLFSCSLMDVMKRVSMTDLQRELNEQQEENKLLMKNLQLNTEAQQVAMFKNADFSKHFQVSSPHQSHLTCCTF